MPMVSLKTKEMTDCVTKCYKDIAFIFITSYNSTEN